MNRVGELKGYFAAERVLSHIENTNSARSNKSNTIIQLLTNRYGHFDIHLSVLNKLRQVDHQLLNFTNIGISNSIGTGGCQLVTNRCQFAVQTLQLSRSCLINESRQTHFVRPHLDYKGISRRDGSLQRRSLSLQFTNRVGRQLLDAAPVPEARKAAISSVNLRS